VDKNGVGKKKTEECQRDYHALQLRTLGTQKKMGQMNNKNYNVRAMTGIKHSHKIALFFTSYSFNLLSLSSSHLSPSNM